MSALKPQAESGMATLKNGHNTQKLTSHALIIFFFTKLFIDVLFFKTVKNCTLPSPPLLSLSAKVFYRISYFKKFKKYPYLFSEE